MAYLNTLPFIYGIKKLGLDSEMELHLDIPSKCAEKLLDQQIDLGLVPVAILPQLEERYVVSDYCIGAEGRVNSVLLYSEVPIHEVTKIVLDYQSRTSVNLVKVLAKHHWKINAIWENGEEGFESKIAGNVAGVVIGDRTFNMKNRFSYVYDLSEEWYKLTGLPFVFACWVANKQLPDAFLNRFNESLKYGVTNIDLAIEADENNLLLSHEKRSYLKNDISYAFDAKKKKALDLFLNYLNTV